MGLRVKCSVALVTAVVAASALAFQGSAGAEPTPTKLSTDKSAWQQDRDYYHNSVPPRVEPADGLDPHVHRAAAAQRTGTAKLKPERRTGFPPAAQQLARREALATAKNISPRQSAKAAGQAQVQHAKLLTLLVEFNPEAKDDFSGFERPNDVIAPTGCVTEPAGTLFSGPVHNQLPNPATVGRRTDNNTFWLPDFSRDVYQELIYSKSGLSQRVRPDLNGGISMKGRSVRTYFAEVSKGRYEIGGTASPWLLLPHSEAWYSADSCAGGRASDAGHPDNPLGQGQMAVDGVKALAAADPQFPWASYDMEDQGDLDGDGNLFEPDGALDHVVVLHAGADQADGGGAQAGYAEWSSSQVVGADTGGITVPAAAGLRVFNYTTQPENAGIGVIAHEYGHDLGLPDLYDVVGPTATDVGWWDVMAEGVFGGEVAQALPTHMGAWSKYVLGWLEPKVLDYGQSAAKLLLGQGSRPPGGTAAAVRVNLPDKKVRIAEPRSGANGWWSSNDQRLADVRVTRTVEVPAGKDIRFWSWNNYTIENRWDYGFIEVSSDGGRTWSQLEVFDQAGNLVSTDEDPNGTLANLFGGAENGLTGDSGGYRHDYVNLTPYAGTTIQLRLRYLTDWLFQERGWFADDFSITTDGAQMFADDVESGLNGWVPEVRSIGSTTGAGWVRSNGITENPQYYLAEWRNLDGYDRGLKTAFSRNYFVGDEWNVSRTPYNAPGLLIWYRDQAFEFNNLASHLFDAPSIGSKGVVLLVDSHFQPARFSGAAAAAARDPLDNLGPVQQASDVAFGPVGRYPFRVCIPNSTSDPYAVACNDFKAKKPILRFTDAFTWYPGAEYRPDLDPNAPLFFSDADASVVVPSKDNEYYSTRVVDRYGHKLPNLYGTHIGLGHVLGSGNPRDGRPADEVDNIPGTDEDLSLGVVFEIKETAKDKRSAWVYVRPGHRGAQP